LRATAAWAAVDEAMRNAETLTWACFGRTGGDTLRVIGMGAQATIEADLDGLKAA
jgi:hypothetical protein